MCKRSYKEVSVNFSSTSVGKFVLTLRNSNLCRTYLYSVL